MIQNQNDAAVAEVMSWLRLRLACKLYSSYPPFTLPLIGDSVHHQPKFDAVQTKGMETLAETVWLLQSEGAYRSE